jgi:hypothetical protein
MCHSMGTNHVAAEIKGYTRVGLHITLADTLKDHV